MLLAAGVAAFHLRPDIGIPEPPPPPSEPEEGEAVPAQLGRRR
jgi:hypothetical protein